MCCNSFFLLLSQFFIDGTDGTVLTVLLDCTYYKFAMGLWQEKPPTQDAQIRSQQESSGELQNQFYIEKLWLKEHFFWIKIDQQLSLN